MSFISDQVIRIDVSLDRAAAASSSQDLPTTLSTTQAQQAKEHLPRILELQRLIKRISPAPSASGTSELPLLTPSQIIRTLQDASAGKPPISSSEATEDSEGSKAYEDGLISLILHKATIQTYALALNAILDQTLDVGRHIWYWDDVLYSRRLPMLGLRTGAPVGLYTYWIQTTPARIYSWGGSVLQDVRLRRGGDLGLSAGWKKFYGLVKEVVRERSLADLQRRAVWLSPLARARNEVTAKKKELKKLRDVGSNAIGLLLGEGLSALGETVHQHETLSVSKSDAALRRSVALLEAVLNVVSGNMDQDQESAVDADGFEERITSLTKLADEEFWATDSSMRIGEEDISLRLQNILSSSLVQYGQASKNQLTEYGRPSRLTRYWLPIVLGVLSSSTLLRIFVNRQEAIITWIREFGVTVKSFWENWVLDPVQKILGTIRHDSGSEIAIMSKRSLEGDRESLERMVVEFAVDTNSSIAGSKLSDAQIEDIRIKIGEGDLTPVLKAYEKDLQRPFWGAVRGNLIRALLIQVQKTKVDVEVAMGGIDSLLKSQELVFGFVGLTPGILVTFATFKWLGNVFGSRQGSALGRKKGRMLGVLRNIDRVLTAAQPSEHGVLYYKDYGLLLCESHVLRQLALATIPEEEMREFLRDLDELTDVRIGVERQRDVTRRMRWGYAKWL